MTTHHPHLPQGQGVHPLGVLAAPEQELAVQVSVQQLLRVQAADGGMEPGHGPGGDSSTLQQARAPDHTHTAVRGHRLVVLIILQWR